MPIYLWRVRDVNRREFIRAATAGAWVAGNIGDRGIADETPASPTLTRPLPRQIAWQRYELGLVYHYDLDVFMPGGHDHERSRREKLDPTLYNPAKYDMDQWLAAAKAAGCGYAIFTATHHQGFLQWQSDAYDFGLRQIAWRGGKADLVRDFVEACRKYGIAPGLYIGIRFNAYWGVYQYKLHGGRGGTPEEQAHYMRICERMVEELCTRYGPLCEIWFDGGVPTPRQGGPDVLPIVEKHQPDAVFYHSADRAEHRWAGNEAGTAGYPCWSTIPDAASQIRAHAGAGRRSLLQHGDPDGAVWSPAMCDAPIREHDWLWVPNREHRLQPLDRLVGMYYQSVGRNANLILGAVPDTNGLIPEPDMRRYAELGAELRRRFARPIAETAGRGTSVELSLEKPSRCDHVIIAEDIALGHRVRAYIVEGLVGGETWRKLCEGTSIGNKRIQRFDPVEVARLRLRVTQCAALPKIDRLAVYGVT